MKGKKFLAIIGIFIIISTISIVSVYIIINTPDNIPPNVIIVSPTAGSTVSGTVTITMDATDANGISSYAIYIDDIFR